MNEEKILNRLEHSLLSMQMDDIEPLFILYADTMRNIEGANLELILQALIKLVNIGFSKCIQHKWGKWRPCNDPSIDKLRHRFDGLSEEKRRKYPEFLCEYYFEITEKGRLEEAKDIYDEYYPNI
jgi:hypothetical protein